MKRKKYKKLLHDRRCLKFQKATKKSCKNKKRINKRNRVEDSNRSMSNRVQKDAPSVFSFTENQVETIDFFADIIDEMKRKSFGKVFYINSSSVTAVSVDVLIYLIAIMQNITINMQMHYSFIGNLPNDKNVAKVYHESGFMDYVSTRGKKLPDNNDKRRIEAGKRNDPIISGELCEFVMGKLGLDIKAIQPIQKILIELMSNVYHHAYKKENDDIMKKKWYIYAEYNGNSVKIIFVDTGVGIAKTVRKKFGEKIAGIFNTDIVKDSELIKSTLLGEFRTETLEPYRGNGLPGVYEQARMPLFSEFNILSGKGQCIVERDGSIACNEFENPICGTIFVFSIVSERE